MKRYLKNFTNLHQSSLDLPDVFIYGCPRSGTTLLLEMIATQPGVKPIKDPFDLRHPLVNAYMKKHDITEWADYHSERAGPIMLDYLGKLQRGKLHMIDPYFFQNYNRIRTTRMACKILHAGEDRIQALNEGLGGKVIYLMRHPIPVARSRRQLPRLEALVHSEMADHLSAQQKKVAKEIFESGSEVQRIVLDWCIENTVALREHHDDWIYLTYEQLVLEPDVVVAALASSLNLPDPAAMMGRLAKPSYSAKYSDEKTHAVVNALETGEESAEAKEGKEWLVYGKWREKISDDEEQEMMGVLDDFGIDFYRRGSARPHSRFWIES